MNYFWGLSSLKTVLKQYSVLKVDDFLFFCCWQALFHALGMDSKDYKFGLSKIFFRPGKVE